MILAFEKLANPDMSLSRVSGGDPEWFRDENLIDRSFPRERG